jgi:excisionase family DNA binding protein
MKSPQESPATAPPSEKRWFTLDEAALYLRCSPQTIRNLIHRRELRASTLGDWGFRLDRADLDHFLEKRKRFFPPYRKGTHPWVAKRWASQRRKRAA